jgi:hypothetical protein
VSYVISCKGQGRCDCCPGNNNPQLCDDLALRLLKEVCVGFDTTADGTAFHIPTAAYITDQVLAPWRASTGAPSCRSLLFAFLTTTEQGFPWWMRKPTPVFVAKLP